MNTKLTSQAITIALAIAQWTCSPQDGGQTRNPQPPQQREWVLPQQREKVLYRTNTQEGHVASDSRMNVEQSFKENKRPQRELDSIVVPAHLSIGQSLNLQRPIKGYFLSNDLTLFERADSSSSIVFRDSAYKWSGFSELSGDGYLVRSEWNVLEYTPEWVRVQYENSIGWLKGRFFAASKVVVFDMNGNRFREFLSPFVNGGIYTVVAGEDSLTFYVSNYKDFYFRINLYTGEVLDTVRSSYLVKHDLVKESYIYTHLDMSEEDFILLEEMRFYPGTFKGRFLQNRVIYIYKNTEFDNSLLSEDYETGKVDTVFYFDRIQLNVAYEVMSLCPLDSRYVVMSMNAYDARY